MSPVELDLSSPRAVHIVGVGGAGMSAIATVLAAMGHRVSGSDLKASPGLERLRAQGVAVSIGHAPGNIDGAEIVAVSTAVPERNVEVQEAARRGLPVLRRADVLSAIAATRRCIAVSGTHGKTTTSSMLSLVLLEAGVRPAFIIGGELNEIGGGAAWSDGDLFVVEADESDSTFVELPAERVVVTAIEADHLDHFGTLAVIEAAFERFVAAAPGPNLVCADDPLAAKVGRSYGTLTYGTAEGADYRIVAPQPSRAGISFDLVGRGEPLGTISLPVPGLHNARNAAAAAAAAVELGIPFSACRSALGRYAGVARRFQFRGEAAGVTVVDDYAHNPGKVRAVLGAARDGGWRRVVAVFQPHRYSRTQDLWRDFGPAFADADLIVVTDVYGAGEPPRPGVNGKLVVDAILESRPWARVAWLPERRDVLGYLAAELRAGDLCLTLGAGDITSLPDELLARLGARAGA